MYVGIDFMEQIQTFDLLRVTVETIKLHLRSTRSIFSTFHLSLGLFENKKL